MAQLIVRNVPDEVKERLRARAAQHGRSLESEVREILASAVATDPVLTWLDTSAAIRDELGGTELPQAERSPSRPVVLP